MTRLSGLTRAASNGGSAWAQSPRLVAGGAELGSLAVLEHTVFFTRQLYDGMQPDSGWERRAQREWIRRWKISRRYEDIIAPLLPATVVRLSRKTLHDAVVESVEQRTDSLTFVMDARRAMGGFAGRRIRLAFTGVRRRVRTRGLVGHWWLHEEAHLSSRARFALHVLFDNAEMEIEADELRIQRA